MPRQLKKSSEERLLSTSEQNLTSQEKANVVANLGVTGFSSLQSALDAKAPVSHTHIIGNVTGLQSALDAKESPAGATVKANAAQAAAVAAAATDATTKDTGLLNLILTSITEPGVAFVSPSLGNNATAVVGSLLRPYSSITAAIVASPKICLLENATWGGGTLSQNLEIHLRNNATLTTTGQASGNVIIKILGFGHFEHSGSSRFLNENQPTKLLVDIKGNMSNASPAGMLHTSDLGQIHVSCKLFKQIATSSVTGAFGYSGAGGGVFFSSGLRFWSSGDPIFVAAGGGVSPRFLFGPDCLIWTNGAAPFGNAGSGGSIYATGLLHNTAAISISTPVSVTGTASQATWLTESLFTDI